VHFRILDDSMKQSFDLHCHTTASDGTLTPEELVEHAYQNQVYTVAITDHDTCAGISEAVEKGKEYNITVIPGIEISVDFNPGTMHICGYYIDPQNKYFQKRITDVQNARNNRNPQIIQKLNESGINITLDEVRHESGKDHIGRPHFAQVLHKKGYVTSVSEAFNKYLAKGSCCYVHRKRLGIPEAIELIHKAHGIAVLAHPNQLGLSSWEEYKKWFIYLKELGIDGIEIFSSCHSKRESEHFKSFADELNLLTTGGSDFHGTNKPEAHLGVFGDNNTINIKELIEQMKKQRNLYTIVT